MRKTGYRPQVRGYREAGAKFAIGLVLLITGTAFGQDSTAMQAVTRKPAHKAVTSHSLPAQGGQEQKSSGTGVGLDLGEYGPLVSELARVATKIQQGVQVPAPRTQSKILPVLPASSSFYFSIANYGETLYQANQIFNQEVQASAVLTDWWQNKVGVAGMMVGGVIEQLHQFTGYLGDELVISGNVKAKGPSVLILAPIKKPGLAAFLQKLLDQYGGKNAPVRILTPQQLLTARAPSANSLLLLIRTDFLVASSDLAALRSINSQLNSGSGTFASTPFGERLGRAYQGGVGVLLGADLQQLLALRPKGQAQTEAVLQSTGFGDLKYLVIDGKYSTGGVSSSNIEVTFNGPRKGIAGWLGAPTALDGLDFVSAHTMYAGALVLKNPAQMFDDIKHIAESANPAASRGLAEAETELSLSFKDDLFAKLGGQMAFAVEGQDGPTPAWKLIFQVSDADGLQKTIQQLMTTFAAKAGGAGPKLEQKNDDGLSYSSVSFATGPKTTEVDYLFAHGYLVMASSSALLKDAVDVHRNGTSLAKSSDFLKLLPSDHSGQASAVLFQNMGLTMSAMAKQLPPDMAALFQSLGGKNKFSVMSAYGEENAVRVSSNSQQVDLLVPLVVAAVAIPNLLRSRTAASEASAAATVRTLNTAESQYSISYANYARDLATLGPAPGADCKNNAGSAKHACLIDGKLGCDSDTWCTHNGFQFNITGKCSQDSCQDYVVVGTPADPGKGGKSFCSTQDMILRSKTGPPLTGPISVDECQTWTPL